MNMDELNHIVEPEILAGEKLLWVGKPARFPIQAHALLSLIGAVVCCLFMFGIFVPLFLTGITGVESTGADTMDVSSQSNHAFMYVVLLFPLAFVFIGLWVLYSSVRRFFSPSRQVYALTDRRGIVFDRFLSTRVVSLYPLGFSRLERKGNDEIGSLIFGDSGLNELMLWWKTPLNGFHNIRSPRDVEALIMSKVLNKK